MADDPSPTEPDDNPSPTHVYAWRAPTCSASTTSGKPCTQPAIKGADVCRMHGGSAPQVRRAAARRVARARVEAELPKILEEIEDALEGTHPVETLDDARRRAAAMVVALSSLLDRESLTDVGGPNADPRPGVIEQMYHRWTQLAAHTSKLAADAGVDERLVRLQEADMALLADLVRRLVVDLADGLGARGCPPEAVSWMTSAWPAMAREALEHLAPTRPIDVESSE